MNSEQTSQKRILFLGKSQFQIPLILYAKEQEI